MLPIKMELTERVAATLRRLRLEYPVDGEILTAENLSKAIGNNRAWMSQIESRRLKKIKREDIIKIYKLLHNEPDENKAEQMAEEDLCSCVENRFDSEQRNSSFVNDSYSEGIISLNNLISNLRDVLLDAYKNLNDNGDRNALLGCIESMIDNFSNDYDHTHAIYTCPISYADPTYFGEEYAKEYYNSLDKVYQQYTLSLHEAFEKADIDSFLGLSCIIYSELIYDINSIEGNESFEDMMDIIMSIENFCKRTFTYIRRVQSGKKHETTLSLDSIFKMLLNLLNSLLNKLNLNYLFTNTIPSFQSTPAELDAKQLELNNAIMLIIKHVSTNRNS